MSTIKNSLIKNQVKILTALIIFVFLIFQNQYNIVFSANEFWEPFPPPECSSGQTINQGCGTAGCSPNAKRICNCIGGRWQCQCIPDSSCGSSGGGGGNCAPAGSPPGSNGCCPGLQNCSGICRTSCSYTPSCGWTDNRPFCAGDGTYCGNPQINSSGGYYCPGYPEWYFCCPGLWVNSGGVCTCPECYSSAPNPAQLIFPIGDVTVYSSNIGIIYNINNGWGTNCAGNYNSHNVYLSQNCTGNYVNLGSTYGFYNLLPNQRYCWFVTKSNGAASSQSQVQSFRTSDNLTNNIISTSQNSCGSHYIGLLGQQLANNPNRWRIYGTVPQNLTLLYVTFAMIPQQNESNDRINKITGITKATEFNNANSVVFDIYRNYIVLYSSVNNFITSYNFNSTNSPFNNYVLENVVITTVNNNYSIEFSIKFLQNFKNNLYSIYSMAVFKDQANNEYSTNSFSQSSNLVLRRYDTNMGSGIWGVDMIPPTVVSGITRFGSKGQIIKFDPLTYIKSSDLHSGINNNFRYFSIRSLGANNGEWKLISQNNNITINTNPHINYSSIGQHINPIGLQQIESGSEYEILNTNVNYQARIGALDNACNFGYRDININSLDSSWITTIDGNVYVEKDLRNVNIPDSAIRFGE